MNQLEAFEYFYTLGHSRSLLKLSKQTGVDFEKLSHWSEVFAWDEKIQARDREVDKAFDAIYKRRTMDIRNRLVTQIDKLLADMEKCSLGLPFAITSPAEMRSVAQAYQCLVQANVLALTKGIDVSGGKTPKTWSDLLQQVEVPQIESSELE